jgi:hypothetical protein
MIFAYPHEFLPAIIKVIGRDDSAHDRGTQPGVVMVLAVLAHGAGPMIFEMPLDMAIFEK